MVIKVLSIVALLNLSLFAQMIYHKGYMYTLVKSPYTGNIWLNKNIGAERECVDYDDKECYGDLFQWGRDSDGHEKDKKRITKAQGYKIKHLDYPFIVSKKKNNRDWAKQMDEDGKARQEFWSRTDGLGVCPRGFRVPSIEEFESETIDGGKVYDNKTALQSFLKFSSSGYRSSDNGVLIDSGFKGYLWSSSINGVYAYSLHFSDDTADSYTHNRADAMPIRCIKHKNK